MWVHTHTYVWYTQVPCELCNGHACLLLFFHRTDSSYAISLRSPSDFRQHSPLCNRPRVCSNGDWMSTRKSTHTRASKDNRLKMRRWSITSYKDERCNSGRHQRFSRVTIIHTALFAYWSLLLFKLNSGLLMSFPYLNMNSSSHSVWKVWTMVNKNDRNHWRKIYYLGVRIARMVETFPK